MVVFLGKMPDCHDIWTFLWFPQKTYTLVFGGNKIAKVAFFPMKKSYFSREYYVIIVYLFKKTIFLLKSFFHPPSIVSQCLSPIIILFFHHSGLFRLLEKKINVITSVSEFAFCPKIKFLHVKDPAKGPEQAIGRNINAYISY